MEFGSLESSSFEKPTNMMNNFCFHLIKELKKIEVYFTVGLFTKFGFLYDFLGP